MEELWKQLKCRNSFLYSERGVQTDKLL